MGSYFVTGDSIQPRGRPHHAGGVGPRAQQDAQVPLQHLRGHQEDRADRVEMKPELIPLAEEKSNFGKVVKKAIREMWALEYEVDELQTKFAESIGTMDLDNLDVDFIEDMMLKAKPLQSVLNCIRNRQIAKLEDVKKLYADQIKDLAAMKVTRPAKPVAAEKPAEPAAAPAPAPEAAKA